jgi:hypothetical protein
MRPRYEEAFRAHLRRLVEAGDLGPDALRVGAFWTRGGQQAEIDAVVLGGQPERAVAVGECTWTERVNAAPLVSLLRDRARALPKVAEDVRYIICARNEVTSAEGALAVTATDIFA